VLSRIALSLSQLSTVNPWTVKPHIRQALDEIGFVAHGKFSGDYGTLVAGTGDNAAVLFDVSERPKSVQGHIALRCRIFPEESDAGERLYVLLEFTEVGKPLGAMWLHWQSDAYVAQTVEELSEDLGMFIFQWKWASHCWARYDIYSHRPRTFASFAYEDIS